MNIQLHNEQVRKNWFTRIEWLVVSTFTSIALINLVKHSTFDIWPLFAHLLVVAVWIINHNVTITK